MWGGGWGRRRGWIIRISRGGRGWDGGVSGGLIQGYWNGRRTKLGWVLGGFWVWNWAKS